MILLQKTPGDNLMVVFILSLIVPLINILVDHYFISTALGIIIWYLFKRYLTNPKRYGLKSFEQLNM